MANRVLRDWTDSERMNGLSVHAERFFVRLIMKVDDFGCYPHNLKLLRSTLFPLLIDEVREADISRWMAECQKAGLILFYEVNGKKLLQIQDFKQRLRQKQSKHPLPCQTNDGQLTDNGRLETKRNEIETKLSPQILDPNDYYTSGQQAFEDMKGDELFIENLERVVHQNGFRACGKLAIALAVKKFLTIEAAKPEFMVRPRRDIRSHLVNWVNVNAEKVASYETERV